jgi:hypothetical protein
VIVSAPEVEVLISTALVAIPVPPKVVLPGKDPKVVCARAPEVNVMTAAQAPAVSSSPCNLALMFLVSFTFLIFLVKFEGECVTHLWVNESLPRFLTRQASQQHSLAKTVPHRGNFSISNLNSLPLVKEKKTFARILSDFNNP